jgi:hypothetical protein
VGIIPLPSLEMLIVVSISEEVLENGCELSSLINNDEREIFIGGKEILCLW